MSKHVLVTGGAGFVGSHLVDALLKRGDTVRVLDNLDPQVHGQTGRPTGHLNPAAEFLHGDVRDASMVTRALEGIEVVVHLAAAVGVGQSMYRIRDYVDVNSLGGATLLQGILDGGRRVERLLVASSMSAYGEGGYSCPACGPVSPPLRSKEQMRQGNWELFCPQCQRTVAAVGTSEEKPLAPTSIYAISKRDHEEMFVCFGKAYGIPTVALRYFNIYGPRQSLSNPYTGAAAIFSSRLLNGNPPLIYEDGHQTRDFVHVLDITAANLLALEAPPEASQVYNVGTGRPMSILQLTELIREQLGQGPAPEILGKFREGDIRHCYADISRARKLLGFAPSIPLEEGVKDLISWVREQRAVDMVEKAAGELDARGLTA